MRINEDIVSQPEIIEREVKKYFEELLFNN